MTKNRLIFSVIMLVFFTPAGVCQVLNRHLEVLEPIINRKWEGVLSAPDGTSAFKVIREFTPVWNGMAIKISKTNVDMDNYAEGIIYWDGIEMKIA